MFQALSTSIRKMLAIRPQNPTSVTLPMELCFQILRLCTLCEVVALRRVSQVWFLAASATQLWQSLLIEEVQKQSLPIELLGLQRKFTCRSWTTWHTSSSTRLDISGRSQHLSNFQSTCRSQLTYLRAYMKMLSISKCLPHCLSSDSIHRLVAMINISDGEVHDLECFPVRSTSLLQINVRSNHSCSVYRYDLTSTEQDPMFLQPTFTFPTPPSVVNDDDFTGRLSWDNQWILFVLPSHSIIVINTVEKVAYRLAVHAAFELAAFRTVFPESLIMEMTEGPSSSSVVNAVVFGFRDRQLAGHSHMAVGLVPLVSPGTPLPTSLQGVQSILSWYSNIPAISVNSATLHVMRELGTSIVDQIRLHKTSPSTFVVVWSPRQAFRAVYSLHDGTFCLDTDEFNPGLLDTIGPFGSAYAPMLGSPCQRRADISWDGSNLFFKLIQSSIDVPPVTQTVRISHLNPQSQTRTMDPFSGRFAWFAYSVNKIVVFDLFRRY